MSEAKNGSGSGIPNIEAVVVFFRQWRKVNATRILSGPLKTQVRLLEEMQPMAALIDQLRANLKRGEQAGSVPSLVETGDVLDCSKTGIVNAGKVETPVIYLDADSGVLL
ncbi:MAG: hypothetical protein NTZ94_18880, partial [Verrucomicrobia bacterium]|nr:hypothetical protein [Verrucomicrobiota bacterium]